MRVRIISKKNGIIVIRMFIFSDSLSFIVMLLPDFFKNPDKLRMWKKIQGNNFFKITEKAYLCRFPLPTSL